MKRLIFNILISVLALILVYVNGVRLYDTQEFYTFEVAEVVDIVGQGDGKLSTVSIVYHEGSRWIEADIPDVPGWVTSQINSDNQMVVYFYNNDYSQIHAVPYSPLQDMMIQSMIMMVAAFGILIIGNSVIGDKKR